MTIRRRYLKVSTDHEVIGVQFLVTSFVFFFIGGLMALIIRAEQFLPGFNFLSGEAYNRLFTNHGSIMIFLALLPAVLGLTHAILPETVGAARSAYPKLSAISFWLVPLAGALMVASFFTGGSSSGWTAYTPLSVRSTGVGQSLWTVSLILMVSSLAFSALTFLTTVRRHQPKDIWETPLFAWSTLTSSFMALVSSPVVLLALVLLLAQRYIGPQLGLMDSSLGVILWQNFFWFFAHPLTLILMLPMIGVICEVVPSYSGRPIVAHRSSALAIIAVAALGMISWGQHMFASGLIPGLRIPFMLVSMAAAIPLGFIVFVWIATIWMGMARFETPMIFALGFISLFLIGGLSGLILASVPINLQLTDSSFVPGHVHFALLGGAISGLFAGIYYWFPKLTGREYDEVLGILHALGHTGGVFLTYSPMFVLGLIGVRRRVFDYPAGQDIELVQLGVTAGALLLATTAMLFLYNMFFSMLRGGSVERSTLEAGWSFQRKGEKDLV
ncbi:MAG: cbb3-type cytochrome c oxidase subunit I [Anaerolineales bacterium]